MSKEEVVVVHTRHVSCDGGQGELGHPKVYIEIKQGVDKVECPYCGKKFEYKDVR